MTAQDHPRVAEIHVFCQRKAYRGFVPDEFLFGKMNVATRLEYLATTMLGESMKAFVFEGDSIVKAFTIMGPCEDDDNLNAYELFRIFVDPFMQGGGIGYKLAAHFEKTAAELGYKNICLWALEGNTSAADFYKKIGYHKDGAKRISGYFDVPEIRFAKRV